jgi:hypothetical protein
VLWPGADALPVRRLLLPLLGMKDVWELVHCRNKTRLLGCAVPRCTATCDYLVSNMEPIHVYNSASGPSADGTCRVVPVQARDMARTYVDTEIELRGSGLQIQWTLPTCCHTIYPRLLETPEFVAGEKTSVGEKQSAKQITQI